MAARWLTARGIDGAALLLAVLDATGEAAAARPEAGKIAPDGPGHLCPITLGSYLSDLGETGVEAVAVLRPALLLPFLQATGARLGWSGGIVTVTREDTLSGDIGALVALERGDIAITAAPGTAPTGAQPMSGADTGADVLRRLDAYAMQTTVPATASSRADAGAGTDDND